MARKSLNPDPEQWTGRAKAFDGRWYPVTVEAHYGWGWIVLSAAGPVAKSVPIEIDCHATLAEQGCGERIVDALASCGYRNVRLSILFPIATPNPEDQP